MPFKRRTRNFDVIGLRIFYGLTMVI